MGRRGFTLVELLIGLVIAAIVGGAAVRLVMGELRSVEKQETWRVARAVTRSGVNRLISDLRMVEATGGIEAAVAGGKNFTVRVPYAFGIICAVTGGGSGATVSLAPVDSAMYAGESGSSGYSGFAWRDGGTGAYTYVATTTAPTTGTVSTCTGAGIQTLSGGRVIQVTGPVPATLSSGTIVFLFRRIRYEFNTSAMISGRTGLWRTQLAGGTAAELAAPFDSTARVRFYVLNGTTAQAAVPSPLSNIRGLELQLDGMSEITPRGATSPNRMSVTTSVFFENRPD